MSAADSVYQAAVLAYDTGDFSQAATVAQYGLLASPDDGRLWEIRGLALYELSDVPGATVAVEHASWRVPLSALGQLVLADCYTAADKPELAWTILTFLAEPDRCPQPLLPKVSAGLGRIGAYTLALEVCERLTALRPTYHPAWFGVAFYRQKLNRPAEDLIDPLFAALQLAPDALTYRLSLAGICDDLGWYPMAYRVVKCVSASRVKCPRMVAKLIRVFSHMGDVKRVLEYEAWLGRMAETDPNGGCGNCETE
jgi:tetratricopeptide (TPR) repeat protein